MLIEVSWKCFTTRLSVRFVILRIVLLLKSKFVEIESMTTKDYQGEIVSILTSCRRQKS